MALIKTPLKLKVSLPIHPIFKKQLLTGNKTEWLEFYFPLHFLSGQGVNENGEAQSVDREEMKMVWKIETVQSNFQQGSADSNIAR